MIELPGVIHSYYGGVMQEISLATDMAKLLFK